MAEWVGLVLIVVVAAPAYPQAPFRVGGSMAMTGRYSALGQNALRGAKLCIKQTNDEGGLLGRKVELAVADDESQPDKAAAIYQKLLAEDKVDAVLSLRISIRLSAHSKSTPMAFRSATRS